VTWRARLPPDDELRSRLGINLRTHREGLGISQHEVARRAKIGIASISPLERGETMPRIDSFIRLAGALEAEPNDLTAGVLWRPAEKIITPGGFEVPPDPELEAEVAALREDARP
jgi:transcriptional regulator with XRE-family HTH domain